MPRTTTQKNPDDTAPVKRAPRRTVAKREPRVTARRRDEAESPARSARSSDNVPLGRKAPTVRPAYPPTAADAAVAQKSRLSLYVSGALFSLGIIAAAMIGYSDDGQINTASIITAHNDRVVAGTAGEDTEDGDIDESASRIVPVQNQDNQLLYGGLVPSDPATAAQAVSSATTPEGAAGLTEEAASSTASTSADGSEQGTTEPDAEPAAEPETTEPTPESE